MATLGVEAANDGFVVMRPQPNGASDDHSSSYSISPSTSKQFLVKPKKKRSKKSADMTPDASLVSLLPPLTPAPHNHKAFAHLPRTPGSILRRKAHAIEASGGAGSATSVRFSKRLYDDGQESSMSLLSAEVSEASTSMVRPDVRRVPSLESAEQITRLFTVASSNAASMEADQRHTNSHLGTRLQVGDVSLHSSSSSISEAGVDTEETPHPGRIVKMRVSRPSLQDAKSRALRRGKHSLDGSDAPRSAASGANSTLSSDGAGSSSSGNSLSNSDQKHGDSSPEKPAGTSVKGPLEHASANDSAWDMSGQLADLPSIESMSNIMDLSADVVALSNYSRPRRSNIGSAEPRPPSSSSESPSASGLSQRPSERILPSTNDNLDVDESNPNDLPVISNNSLAAVGQADVNDQSLSLSISTLQREVKGFQVGWRIEEEKEKRRRISMSLSTAGQTPFDSEERALMDADGIVPDGKVHVGVEVEAAGSGSDSDSNEVPAETNTSVRRGSLQELSQLPLSLPLPPSPTTSESDESSSSLLPPLETSPTIRGYSEQPLALPTQSAIDSTGDSTNLNSSQLSSQALQLQGEQHMFPCGRKLTRPVFQRQSTPLDSPSSPALFSSPSTRRLGRRDAAKPDLRRQLAMKVLSTPATAERSLSLSRMGSCSLFDISRRSHSSLNASSVGSASISHNSAYFDADDSANLSAVFETARELDEVHTERTAHLIERLQQGDSEILELRQTLQRVSSSEVDTLKEYERMKQRVDAAELALLREKEEAFAAARLQDQQHAEVSALIERLKLEIDQQQLELEAKMQAQNKQQALLQVKVQKLQEELSAEVQRRVQEQRDFEVRLLVARAEERESAEQSLQTEIEQASRLSKESCERDFAIRLSREMENIQAAKAQLEDKLAITEEQLVAIRDNEDLLRKDVEALREGINSALNERLREAQHEVDLLKASVEAERSAASAAAAQEHQRQEALSELQYELRSLHNKCDELEDALQEARDQQSEAQRAAQELQADVQHGQLREQRIRDDASEKVAHLQRLVDSLRIREDQANDEGLGGGVASRQPCETCQGRAALMETQVATQDMVKANTRIKTLEIEFANRGIELAKLRKKQEQLEQDNRNYGIALSAKQNELNMLRRNGGIRYAMPRTPLDSAIPNTIRRLGLEPMSPSFRPGPKLQHASEASFALEEGLSKGPAQLKARGRKSFENDNSRAESLGALFKGKVPKIDGEKEIAGRSPRKGTRRMPVAVE
ncbi:hypothetical protein K437DRAFT_270358 [Tilletiaria anomala UBC 951]|uniref:Uncharacterized protein n=1 Tax=Tilletiaria anomala (strain ATCC 24038 / CBS 436.72 / UBC 951) TaxID=1037660 RepID=A0A066VBY4_TILAU|nr:uncharacterized protein K437DRAFT_270358 [Tilletiaria anomala UBC 951]KDN39257.1 hypothetical protein K437DRAFT_270358 [Tilletiaria anomala UBC 951]